MRVVKVYTVRIPSYGYGENSFYEIPVKIEKGWMEKTIGLGDISTYKEYLRNMHPDWLDALVFPVRRSDGSLTPPSEGETLRVSGHGGIADIGIIEKIVEYKSVK